MPTRKRKSYLTPAHARILRESAGLSPKEWADLLHCGVQSVRNMESDKGQTAIGRQMAALMMYLTSATIRDLAIKAELHATQLLFTTPHNTP